MEDCHLENDESHYQLIECNCSLCRKIALGIGDKDVCKSSLFTFLENYQIIFNFNQPVLKFFHESYYPDVIGPLLLFSKKNADEWKIFKKISPHFKIYPFWEYLSLIGGIGPFKYMDSDRKEKELNRLKDFLQTLDCSVFLKLIKQLIVILEYNLFERNEKDKNIENVQIYPILGEYLDEASVEELQQICDHDINLMVIELIQIPEAYCFIVPKARDQCEKFYKIEKLNNFLSFNKMEDELKKISINFRRWKKILLIFVDLENFYK